MSILCGAHNFCRSANICASNGIAIQSQTEFIVLSGGSWNLFEHSLAGDGGVFVVKSENPWKPNYFRRMVTTNIPNEYNNCNVDGHGPIAVRWIVLIQSIPSGLISKLQFPSSTASWLEWLCLPGYAELSCGACKLPTRLNFARFLDIQL